ncbi:MAG: hypothetical protein BJ554DRAFT_267 [Olpidium bornovanus]|uniref:Uncharacterized protein n=1 Tax=Olpidium bornovanus TaxID=278681 RepID=A0A8H7ZTQ8_9FUNG|nr:MAG: hypothetical protein BJ554DRAFT_267 [Olpidium bornovanus]
MFLNRRKFPEDCHSSFDESALRKLGRDHTAGGGMAAIAESKQVFPGKVTFDLIFGLPGQSLSHWRTQLQVPWSLALGLFFFLLCPGDLPHACPYSIRTQLGLDLADNHLSMYQLTIERGTHPLIFVPLYRLYRDIHLHKNTELPDDDVVADMYEETIARSKDAGFEHYEVSSFARSSENRGKHNCGYWMGYDYIGAH